MVGSDRPDSSYEKCKNVEKDRTNLIVERSIKVLRAKSPSFAIKTKAYHGESSSLRIVKKAITKTERALWGEALTLLAPNQEAWGQENVSDDGEGEAGAIVTGTVIAFEFT